MSNLTLELENAMGAALRAMKPEFDTHQFILKLASENQKEYIDALAAIDSTKPFQTLHSAIGKKLKQKATDGEFAIQETASNVSSPNIFGKQSSCSRWQRISESSN